MQQTRPRFRKWIPIWWNRWSIVQLLTTVSMNRLINLALSGDTKSTVPLMGTQAATASNENKALVVPWPKHLLINCISNVTISLSFDGIAVPCLLGMLRSVGCSKWKPCQSWFLLMSWLLCSLENWWSCLWFDASSLFGLCCPALLLKNRVW